MSLWKKVDVVYNGRLPLAVYTSLRSGQRIAIGDVPGPMVKACISLVTETNTDDGLPHTLEHLVFMGSKQYPFKGFMDVIANRCFASGTNAWTGQDHTAYTVDTVGAEGFYKIFPIYLNHILRPTLTKEQYATEVHHVNEKGEDAGVVYCEMQDYSLDMDEILSRRMKQLLYPEGHPYSVETGGTIEDIRRLCSPDRVRDFHSKFYHLANLLCVVCGRVETPKLLKMLEELEESEADLVPAAPKKHFTETVPPLTKDVVESIKCPVDDESHGSLRVTWLSHSAKDIVSIEALSILFVYLTDTAVSPFHRMFIDIPDPLASNVYFQLSEQSRNAIELSFGGVPSSKLVNILPLSAESLGFKLKDVLKKHEDPSAFDANRMGFVCRQAMLNSYSQMESSPAKTIFELLITHQIYGESSEEDLKKRFDEANIIKQLGSQPMKYWAELVANVFGGPLVAVIGNPDKLLSEEMTENEEQRVDKQRKELGDHGLQRCQQLCAQAIAANESAAPPDDLLEKLMVRELEEFDRFTLEVSSSEEREMAGEAARKILKSIPFPSTIHHTPETNFVELYVVLDTAELSEKQRRLLYVFKEILFESPAIVEGKKLSADEVCNLYTRDLLEHDLSIGFSGFYERAVVLSLKVDAERFLNLVKWTEIFLKGLVMDAERIGLTATRLAGEARELKRDGNYVALTVISKLINKPDSNEYLASELVLQKVHEALASQARKDPDSVVGMFEELRNALLLRGMNAHIVCNVDAVPVQAPEIWQFAKTDIAPIRFQFIPGESHKSSFAGADFLVPLGACESSFLMQKSALEVSWDSDLLVSASLLSQYLSQSEGPLWKAVRGGGLAYGVWIAVNVDDQEMCLSIYRSSNVAEAYKKTHELVVCELSREEGLDLTQFEAAKRSLICELHGKESSISNAGRASVLRALQNNRAQFLKDFTNKLWVAKASEVLKLGTPPILRLFEKYARSISAHSRQVSEIKATFPSIRVSSVKHIPIQP